MLRIENDNSTEMAIVQSRGFVIEGMYEGGVKALVINNNIYVLIGCTLITMELGLHHEIQKISSKLFSNQEDQMSLMRETSITYNNSILFVMNKQLFVVDLITAATKKLDPALVNLIGIAYDMSSQSVQIGGPTALCN